MFKKLIKLTQEKNQVSEIKAINMLYKTSTEMRQLLKEADNCLKYFDANRFIEQNLDLSSEWFGILWDFTKKDYKIVYKGKLQTGWDVTLSIPVSSSMTELTKFAALVDSFILNRIVTLEKIDERSL